MALIDRGAALDEVDIEGTFFFALFWLVFIVLAFSS